MIDEREGKTYPSMYNHVKWLYKPGCLTNSGINYIKPLFSL